MPESMPAASRPDESRPPPGGGEAASPGVALVTGAGQRLGRAMALALARQGWDVGVHFGRSEAQARDTVNAILALGRRAVAVAADLADETQVLGLMPAVSVALGAPVRCLVNNASRFEFDEARTVSSDSLTAHLLPNLVAPVLLARELDRQLPDDAKTAGPQAVIVNLLDQKLYGMNPDFLSYTLSKAGLACATTALAQALAPRIRVVGVAPGLTLASYLQDDGRFERAHRDSSPLGRSSTVDDVVSAVLFAVSNRSITGSVIVCDGGQHLKPLARDVSLLDS